MSAPARSGLGNRRALCQMDSDPAGQLSSLVGDSQPRSTGSDGRSSPLPPPQQPSPERDDRPAHGTVPTSEGTLLPSSDRSLGSSLPILHPKPAVRTYSRRAAPALTDPFASDATPPPPRTPLQPAPDVLAPVARTSSVVVPESEDLAALPPSADGDLKDVTMPDASQSDDYDASVRDDDDDESPEDSIFKRKSIQELMAEEDARAREEDEAEEAARRVATPVVPPTSSSLPPLTPSDPPVTQPTSQSDTPLPIVKLTSAVLLSSTSYDRDVSMPTSADLGADVEDDDEAVPARRVVKALRIVVDSDDEDEDGSDSSLAKVGKNNPVPTLLNVASSSEPSPAPPAATEPPESKRERLEKMAARKRPPVKETKSLPGASDGKLSEPESISESDSGDVLDRKGKGRKTRKGQTKKDEDAMNRTSAAFLRNQHVSIQPRTKQNISVKETVGRAQKEPPPAPTFKVLKASKLPMTSRMPTPMSVKPPPPLESASSIIIASSSSPFVRETPTSDAVSSPQVARSRRFVPPPVDRRPTPAPAPMPYDDEDDLPDLATVVRNVELEKQAEKEAAAREERAKVLSRAKQQAVAAAAALAAQSDSDSDDLEIVKPRSWRSTSSPPPTPQSVLAIASRTPRLSKNARKIHDLVGLNTHAHDDDVTNSQMVSAGRTYGAALAPGHLEFLNGNKRPKKPVHASAGVGLSRDGMNGMLELTAKEQRMRTREAKEQKYRGKASERAAKARQAELAAVDVDGVLAQKEARIKEAEENGEIVDEDDLDGDWVGSDDDVVRGSGDESAYEASGDEAGSGSEAEMGTEDAGDDASDDGNLEPSQGDESMPPPPAIPRRTAFRIEDDEEESSGLVATPRDATERTDDGPEPVRMNLFGAVSAGSGGFTQLFGFDDGDEGVSQFDDGVSGSTDAPLPTFGGRVVGDADLEADANELEAYGAEQTPRTRPAGPLRFLNKHGLLTQTRPPANFEHSPFESPTGSARSISRTESLATTETRSQVSQTQVEPDTPTQAPRRGRLVRANALIAYASLDIEPELQATDVQPEPTEIDVPPTELASYVSVQLSDAQVDEEGDSQMSDLQSEAQAPLRNAFDVLRSTTSRLRSPTAVAKTKTANPFIDNQADLSDEEVGFGGGSEDEDETGLDAELDELVDHSVVDEELAAAQDLLAQELHAEALAQEDAAHEARMRGVADGKERRKRKNGGLSDLSDDEFDDDGYGMTKKKDKKVKRVKNATMEELEANEETQAFAKPLKDGLGVPIKDGECDFLIAPDEDGRESDDDDAELEDDGDGTETDDYDSDRLPRLTLKQAERQMVEQARARERRDLSFSPPPSPRLFAGVSSSPNGMTRVNVAPVTKKVKLLVPGQETLAAKYSNASWKADSREESQGNGKTAGKGSAVTSFKKVQSGVKATLGGTISAGQNGKTVVNARESKLGGYRKGGGFK